MLDIRFIRENPEVVKENINNNILWSIAPRKEKFSSKKKALRASRSDRSPQLTTKTRQNALKTTIKRANFGRIEQKTA